MAGGGEAELAHPRQPHAIGDIGLAAPELLDLAGVDQRRGDAGRLQRLERCQPVDAGPFHHRGRRLSVRAARRPSCRGRWPGPRRCASRPGARRCRGVHRCCIPRSFVMISRFIPDRRRLDFSHCPVIVGKPGADVRRHRGARAEHGGGGADRLGLPARRRRTGAVGGCAWGRQRIQNCASSPAKRSSGPLWHERSLSRSAS